MPESLKATRSRPSAGDADNAHQLQRRATLLLFLSRGVFFASAYVVSAILARLLGPADFGIYGVIVSQLFWLELVVHAGVPAATLKLMADGRHDPEDVARSSRLLLAGSSAVLLLAGWILAPAVARLMGVAGGELLYRIALIDLPLAAVYASYEAILYAERRFSVLATTQIAFALFRVAAVSTLLSVGASIERALVAIVVSTLAVCALLWRRDPPKGIRASRATTLDIARFAGPMAVCLISGQVLLNLDLWSLKSLWTGQADVVGEYVASLNLARTLSVIPTVQAGVLFSSVAWASAAGNRGLAARHIQEASRFAIVIAAGASVVLGTNGSSVLAVLFSNAYAGGQRFLPFQLAGFSLFALLDVFANALMAAGRHRLVAAVLTTAVPVAWVSNYVLVPGIGPRGAAISLVIGIGYATIVVGLIAWRHFGALIRLPTVIRVLAASSIVGLASAAVDLPGPWVLVELALLGGLYLLTLHLLQEITPHDFGGADTSRLDG